MTLNLFSAICLKANESQIDPIGHLLVKKKRRWFCYIRNDGGKGKGRDFFQCPDD